MTTGLAGLDNLASHFSQLGIATAICCYKLMSAHNLPCFKQELKSSVSSACAKLSSATNN